MNRLCRRSPSANFFFFYFSGDVYTFMHFLRAFYAVCLNLQVKVRCFRVTPSTLSRSIYILDTVNFFICNIDSKTKSFTVR